MRAMQLLESGNGIVCLCATVCVRQGHNRKGLKFSIQSPRLRLEYDGRVQNRRELKGIVIGCDRGGYECYAQHCTALHCTAAHGATGLIK